MSLQIPSFTPSQNQFAGPVSNAYAWINELHVNYVDGSGSVGVAVYFSAVAGNTPGCAPIDQIHIAIGADMGHGVAFPTLKEIIAAAAQAQQANPALNPEAAIGQVLYTALRNHPRFAGATQVP